MVINAVSLLAGSAGMSNNSLMRSSPMPCAARSLMRWNTARSDVAYIRFLPDRGARCLAKTSAHRRKVEGGICVYSLTCLGESIAVNSFRLVEWPLTFDYMNCLGEFKRTFLTAGILRVQFKRFVTISPLPVQLECHVDQPGRFDDEIGLDFPIHCAYNTY